MARPHVRLDGGRWNLWRLGDDEFVTLGHHALPLVQNEVLVAELNQRPLAPDEPCTLGHWLTALERRFGPSSPLFDTYHGSFSFPLLLTFECPQRVSCLLRCHDYRASLHVPLYQVVAGDPSEEERSRVHPLPSDVMGSTESDSFIRSFYEHLRGIASGLRQDPVSPFYRAIPSDTLLYGYDGVRFFEHSHSHRAAFDAARAQLEEQLGTRRPRTASNRVEQMIDRVTES